MALQVHVSTKSKSRVSKLICKKKVSIWTRTFGSKFSFSFPHSTQQFVLFLKKNMDSDLLKAVSLGTSIMAVEFDGGVVLGADSRTT